MKKLLLAVLVTLGVAAIAGGFMIKKINEEHKAEIDRLKYDQQLEVDVLTRQYNDVVEEYGRTIDKLDRTEEKLNELYEEIWNMQNGEAYEVSVEHGDETHVWKSNNKGIFRSVSHMVIY